MKCGKAVLLRKFLINSLPTAWIFSSVTTDPVDDSFSSILDKMFQFVDFEGNAERIFRRIMSFEFAFSLRLRSQVFLVYLRLHELNWMNAFRSFCIYDDDEIMILRLFLDIHNRNQMHQHQPTPVLCFCCCCFSSFHWMFFFIKCVFFFSSRRYFNVACKFEVSDFKSMIVKSVCVASGSLSQH